MYQDLTWQINCLNTIHTNKVDQVIRWAQPFHDLKILDEINTINLSNTMAQA